MIYFVQAYLGGPIKIGFTDNLTKRLSSLRSSNPEHLVLLGVMEGDREVEKRIHALFDQKQGEWFYPSPDLMAFIRLNVEEELRPEPAYRRRGLRSPEQLPEPDDEPEIF